MPATVVTRAKAALRARKTSVKTHPVTAVEGSFRKRAEDPERILRRASPDPERHSRKCKICNHPDRAAIEELFIHWHSPQSIRGDFAMRHPFDWSAVYRHARATGLYAKRAKNLRAVLDHLLANVTNVPPTAHGIIAAVRAYACLTDENQWVEPQRRVHIVNEVYRHDGPAPASVFVPTSAPAAPANSPEPSAVTSTGHAPNQSVTSLSSPFPRPGAQPKSVSYASSPLACPEEQRGTRPLSPPSNRQTSELKSPPTRT